MGRDCGFSGGGQLDPSIIHPPDRSPEVSPRDKTLHLPPPYLFVASQQELVLGVLLWQIDKVSKGRTSMQKETCWYL